MYVSQIRQPKINSVSESRHPKRAVGLTPMAVRNVGRNRGRCFFALQHSLREPMKPFVPSLPVQGASPFFGIDFQFLPRDYKWTTKKIIHQIKCHFSAINQNTEAFPGERD